MICRAKRAPLETLEILSREHAVLRHMLMGALLMIITWICDGYHIFTSWHMPVPWLLEPAWIYTLTIMKCQDVIAAMAYFQA